MHIQRTNPSPFSLSSILQTAAEQRSVCHDRISTLSCGSRGFRSASSLANMTGQTCLLSSVIILLLFGILLNNFSKNYHELMLNERLGHHTLEACKESTMAKIDIFPTYKKRGVYNMWQMVPTTRKFQMANRFVNFALTAGLIVLSNDVCPNPGPTISPSRKGMRFFHLNICSIYETNWMN